MNGHDMSGWGWIAMAAILIMGLAIAGGVLWAIARRPSPQRIPSARELLDARLARGEIDAEEHREILAALRGDTANLRQRD